MLKISSIESVAAVLATQTGRLHGVLPPRDGDGLVVFEVEADDAAMDVLARYAAGQLEGDLHDFADHMRRLRGLLRRAREQAR